MLPAARKAVCPATMANGHLAEMTFLSALSVIKGLLGVSKWYESIRDICAFLNDKAGGKIGLVRLVGGDYEDTNCVSRNTNVHHADRVNFGKRQSGFGSGYKEDA